MKQTLLASVSAAALFYFTSPVHADSLGGGDGWYVSMFAGASAADSVDTANVGYTVSADFDSGYMFGLTAGRRISPNLRVEAELSYGRYKGDGGTRYGAIYGGYSMAVVDGDLSATYLLANVWYDFPSTGAWTSYAGGGLALRM